MADRRLIPGKFVWFELFTRDAKKAQAFYRDVLGWKVQAFPMGPRPYEMIFATDTMIGGYALPAGDEAADHWLSYVSVEDVDAAAKLAESAGGRLVSAPHDVPRVGRRARIADPQGAEIGVFTSARGDEPDALAPDGRWFWNELHTPDVPAALAFYERVLGLKGRAIDMGPPGTYHVLARDGVDRAGVTSHGTDSQAPHWLPYVKVGDPDATLARARKLGGAVRLGPEDIPGVGRFGILTDPAGASLAAMNPLPRMVHV